MGECSVLHRCRRPQRLARSENTHPTQLRRLVLTDSFPGRPSNPQRSQHGPGPDSDHQGNNLDNNWIIFTHQKFSYKMAFIRHPHTLPVGAK